MQILKPKKLLRATIELETTQLRPWRRQPIERENIGELNGPDIYLIRTYEENYHLINDLLVSQMMP
jgi:hypothetical protein